jgi:acyl-phosphate glycerol 3-phosphate acyltransferase
MPVLENGKGCKAKACNIAFLLHNGPVFSIDLDDDEEEYFERESMNNVLFTIAAYLIGSISFAVVVSKVFGLADPRSYGSKNPGATNVLRSGNKAAAALTLLGDGAKGWFAVWFAQHYGPQFGIDDTGIALVALGVFLGHLWPVFL